MKKIILAFSIGIYTLAAFAQAEYKGHFVTGGEGMNPQSFFNGSFGIDFMDIHQDEIVMASYAYGDTVDVDPNFSTDYFIVPNPGVGEPVILKTDTSGNFIWAIKIECPDNLNKIKIRDLVIDPATGDIYITGELYGTVDMNPGTGINTITSPYSSGDYNAFIAKYNSAGLYQWAHGFGGKLSFGCGVEMHVNGNVVVVGSNNENGDLNPGAGVSTNLGSGGYDFFIAEFNSIGNYVKGFSWGSVSSGSGGWCDWPSLYKLNNEKFLILGWSSSNANIDPLGSVTNPADGMVVIELDTGFNFIHGQNILNRPYGFFNNDFVEDKLGNKYFSMRFQGTVDIDPTASVNSVGASGSEDHVIMKLSDDYSYEWSRVIGGPAGASFQISLGTTYSDELIVFGDYQGTLDIDLGTGSTTLTAYHATFARELFCAIYDDASNLIWGERIPMTDGYSEWPSMTMKGTTMYISAYISSFNDDMDLAFGTDSEILVYNQQESALLAKYAFCPSSTDVNTTIDIATNLTLSTAQVGDLYQWVDCNNANAPISGATSPLYLPTQDGTYACEISLGYCSYLSDCATVFGVGIESAESISFSLFPNPSDGSVSVILNGNSKVILTVFDASGKIIYTTIPTTTSLQLELPAGVYFVELSGENGFGKTKKLIVK